MRLGILADTKTSHRPFAVLSAVVLAAGVSAGLLLPINTERDALGGSTSKAVPDLQFEDARGDALTLANFRGKVVLLNVWATWCVPCRKEMPALDRLQARLGGTDFQVVALSIDRGGLDVVKRFFDQIEVRSLGIYLDRSSSAMSALAITGIPTTLLIDREGREVRRWVGAVEWDGPGIEALIRRSVEPAASGPEISSSDSKVKQ